MANNKSLISSIGLILLGILIGLAAFYLAQQSGWVSPAGAGLSPEKAGERVVDYLNNNILKGQGLTASLVETPFKQGGVYRLKIKIGQEELVSYLTGDGQLLFPQAIDLTELGEQEERGEAVTTTTTTTTIGNFSVSEAEICQEQGKPLVYFFGSQSCPYCRWEHPIVEEVAEKFAGLISFHNNMDSEQDREVFAKYSPDGYIPCLVLGCQYFRVGAGTNFGEEQEAKILTALICDLTGGQPSTVCGEVQDLINQTQ